MSERAEWKCAACGVRIYRPGKKSIPAPKGWRHSDDTCLKCQRSGEDSADAARRALLDGYAAADAVKIAGGSVSRSAVRKWRDEYVAEGRLPAEEPALRVDTKPKPKRKRKPKPKPTAAEKRDELREKIKAELRADPDRPSAEVADALGTTYGQVRRVRKSLGLPKPRTKKRRATQKTDKRRRVEAALKAEPHRTSREISEATNVSISMVRVARREAGIPAPEVDNRGRPVGA